ncbi:MAG: hypothetical protein Q8R96_11530 [Bacteroidota bacterium]|nr:hypothetical protein [Bacteroidota bacterium]
MTERQLIIVRIIIEAVKDKSVFNSKVPCYEQPGFNVPMELSEFLELGNIKNYLDDLLADLPAMVG